MSDNLYDRPDLYDLVCPPDPEMEAFYVTEALKGGSRVLELACGTGRFAIPMALAGAKVTGGDLSETMLARARRAVAERGVELDLVALDMRRFDLGGPPFDTVVLAANSLLHLHTDDDFALFFRSVLRHLAPQGRLVFDVFVPSLTMLNAGPGRRLPVQSVLHPTLGAVTLEETIDYDPVAQVSHVEWYWSTESAPDFWRTPLELRQIFPAELPMLLASGGLRLAQRYGDFARNPFTRESRRQVCIAERA